MAAAAPAAAATQRAAGGLLEVGADEKQREVSPEKLLSALRRFSLDEMAAAAAAATAAAEAAAAAGQAVTAGRWLVFCRWLQQQQTLERLSALLHQEAVSGGPETTQRLFCEGAKVGLLIEELITLDVWTEKVRPLLTDTSDLAGIAVYLPVYQEGLLASMLETLFFHSAAAAAADAQLPDLVEYCNRKIQRLLLRRSEAPEAAAACSEYPKEAGAAAAAAAAAADIERQQEQQEDAAAFGSEVCAVSLLRFICGHRKHLQMTVTTLLLDQYDVLLTLTGLLEHQPWRRRGPSGQVEIYEDQQWRPAQERDVRITKIAAQVWLTIYTLVMDADCRQRYELTNYRKENLLKLRRYLNEVMYDQIPPLKELHRYLELSLVGLSSVSPLLPACPSAACSLCCCLLLLACCFRCVAAACCLLAAAPSPLDPDARDSFLL
ncbi:hypothetical protein Efla_003931 [Eimeria flavescens]